MPHAITGFATPLVLLTALTVGQFAACSSVYAQQDTSQENPVIAEVLRQLGDRSPDKPFVLMVTLKCKEGQAKPLAEAMAKATKATREEPQNTRYQLLQAATEPNSYLLAEQWKSVRGLSEHLAKPAIIELLISFDTILAEPPALTVMTPVNLKLGKSKAQSDAQSQPKSKAVSEVAE